MTETKKDEQKFQFQHNDHEVFHVREMDINADLLILTQKTKDNPEKIIIPVDKNIMSSNFKYFEAMFREGSNWEEKNNKFTEIIIPYKNVSGKLIAEYLTCAYANNLKLSVDNCLSYFFIGQFLGSRSKNAKLLTKKSICVIKGIRLFNQISRFGFKLLADISNHRLLIYKDQALTTELSWLTCIDNEGIVKH